MALEQPKNQHELPDVDYSIQRNLVDPASIATAPHLLEFLEYVGEALDLRLPDGRLIPAIFADTPHAGLAFDSELCVVISARYARDYYRDHPDFAHTQISVVTTYIHECAHRLVSLIPWTGSWTHRTPRAHGLIFGIVNLAILIRATSLRRDFPFSAMRNFGLADGSAQTAFLSRAQFNAGKIYNWSDVADSRFACDDRRPRSCVAEWDLFSLWLLFGIRAASRFAVSDLTPAEIAREAAALAERYLPDFSPRPSWARSRPWNLFYPSARRSQRIQAAADRFLEEFFGSENSPLRSLSGGSK